MVSRMPSKSALDYCRTLRHVLGLRWNNLIFIKAGSRYWCYHGKAKNWWWHLVSSRHVIALTASLFTAVILGRENSHSGNSITLRKKFPSRIETHYMNTIPKGNIVQGACTKKKTPVLWIFFFFKKNPLASQLIIWKLNPRMIVAVMHL